MFHCLHDYFLSSIEPRLFYTSFDDLNIILDRTVVRKVTLYIVLISIGRFLSSQVWSVLLLIV